MSSSGIDEWSTIAQAGVFVSTYIGLAGGTYIGSNIVLDDVLSKSIFGLEQWRKNVIETTLPILLGTFYTSAGIGHLFVAPEAFQKIYPPVGTWGFWYVPGTAAFHVAWTGVVEALGGMGLFVGVVQNIRNNDDDDEEEEESSLVFKLIQPVSALALFLLTLLVTPANIYMFTHGATMGSSDNMPALDLSFHAIRFVVQIILLSLLWTLAKDSFFFVWGDELD